MQNNKAKLINSKTISEWNLSITYMTHTRTVLIIICKLIFHIYCKRQCSGRVEHTNHIQNVNSARLNVWTFSHTNEHNKEKLGAHNLTDFIDANTNLTRDTIALEFCINWKLPFGFDVAELCCSFWWRTVSVRTRHLLKCYEANSLFFSSILCF